MIELLVVIAIIAILAAILFPIFARARESGRQATCLMHLKQLGQALRGYCDDWNNYLPAVRFYDILNVYPGMQSWDGMYLEGGQGRTDPSRGSLWSYVKNKGVYLCPSDKSRAANWYYGLKSHPRSYSMNGRLGFRNIETMQLASGVHDSTSTSYRTNAPGAGLLHNRLSKMCLMLHESRDTIDDGEWNWWDRYMNLPDTVHFNGTTLLYGDWHAKWLNATSIRAAVDKGEYEPDR